MEENRDYHAYRYGDHLTPGSELKIEHSVVCENVDISTLITMGTDSLEAMRQGSIDGEQKAYEIVVAAAKQWEQQAAATQTINRALEYLRTPEIEHTGIPHGTGFGTVRALGKGHHCLYAAQLKPQLPPGVKGKGSGL